VLFSYGSLVWFINSNRYRAGYKSRPLVIKNIGKRGMEKKRVQIKWAELKQAIVKSSDDIVYEYRNR
jgi:hypothetical protein